MSDLTPTEEDIKIASIALYDYFRDLLIMQDRGHPAQQFIWARDQFGDYVIKLIRAIKANEKS